MIAENNREIWAGENRFYLGEDGIMYVELVGEYVGEYDLHETLALKNAFLELLGLAEGKVNILVNNSSSKKPSKEGRKVLAEMIDDKRCGKIAVLGLNPISRLIASFVLGGAKNKDVNIFKTKDDALMWLKE